MDKNNKLQNHTTNNNVVDEIDLVLVSDVASLQNSLLLEKLEEQLKFAVN